MQSVEKKSSFGVGLGLGLVRCFNTAAFVALSAFYFGMFCLGNPVIKQVELLPLFHGAANEALNNTARTASIAATIAASKGAPASAPGFPSINSAI
jgi:hypothetical protein